VNSKSQVVGSYKDLSLRWVEVHDGHAVTFTGTFVPGSGLVTGMFSDMGGAQGAFEFDIFHLHIMNPTKIHMAPHEYLKSLPDLAQTHRESPFSETLDAGFYVARGKTVNSVTGKETNTPDLLLSLRDDGSLLGRTSFLSNTTDGDPVVRVGGVWNKEGFMYAFIYGSKTFAFTGFLVPNTEDIIGGDYKFGKSGKGQGRFAFHLKRAEFPAQANLDHTSSGSLSSLSDLHSSLSALHSSLSSALASSASDSDGHPLSSNVHDSTDLTDSTIPRAHSGEGVAYSSSLLEFSPSITSSRPGNVFDMGAKDVSV